MLRGYFVEAMNRKRRAASKLQPRFQPCRSLADSLPVFEEHALQWRERMQRRFSLLARFRLPIALAEAGEAVHDHLVSHGEVLLELLLRRRTTLLRGTQRPHPGERRPLLLEERIHVPAGANGPLFNRAPGREEIWI